MRENHSTEKYLFSFPDSIRSSLCFPMAIIRNRASTTWILLKIKQNLNVKKMEEFDSGEILQLPEDYFSWLDDVDM